MSITTRATAVIGNVSGLEAEECKEIAAALESAGLLVHAPLREECHFAPYGSYKATCGETVPVPSEWDEKVGNYISHRFTVYRDETTCWACRAQFTNVAAVDRAEGDGKAET